jgi:hypothetical protein
MTVSSMHLPARVWKLHGNLSPHERGHNRLNPSGESQYLWDKTGSVEQPTGLAGSW